MKLSNLLLILIITISLTATLHGQNAEVYFRTGTALPPHWCPILDSNSDPLPDGSYIGIYLTGIDGMVDPPSSDPPTCGEPTGDDILVINNSIGNGLDHLVMGYEEPPFVPNGNLFSGNGTIVIPPAGSGIEPLVNIGDVMYLRAFNSDHYSTATHYNDLMTVDSVAQNTYTCMDPGTATVIVCFTEAIALGCGPIPCTPQESAGPEGPIVIEAGDTYYFFEEWEASHCTLWITAGESPVTVTATVYDQQPPCKPFPETNYMTRYIDLQGYCDSFFDLYVGYSQSEYNASDYGPYEPDLHLAWFDGDTANCLGEWVKQIPTLITYLDSGGYCHVNTDQITLWSFEHNGGPIPGPPVPPELISFTATAGDRLIILNWVTLCEYFMRGYYVERSTDGVNFATVSPMIESSLWFDEVEQTYTDRQVINGVQYYYRINPLLWDSLESFDNLIITVTPSFLGEATVITDYQLHQNFPNPFNPTTTIVYDLPARRPVRLTVYNVLGEKVATLVDKVKDQGRYAATFDANSLPSGIYFCQLEAGTFKDIKKMILTH